MIVCVVNAFRQHFRPFDLFLLQKTLISAQVYDSIGPVVSHPLTLDEKQSDDIKERTHAGVAGRRPEETEDGEELGRMALKAGMVSERSLDR